MRTKVCSHQKEAEKDSISSIRAIWSQIWVLKGHDRKRWSIDSSSVLQRMQMLGPCQFFFLRLSHVRIGLLTTIQRNALVFNDTLAFQMAIANLHRIPPSFSLYQAFLTVNTLLWSQSQGRLYLLLIWMEVVGEKTISYFYTFILLLSCTCVSSPMSWMTIQLKF